MLGSFDIETSLIKGGEKPQFKMGCIYLEKRKKGEIYHNPNEMWERIIELGKKEYKRGKTLTMYAHNIAFDFFGIANLKDKNIKYFCHKPFIASYMYNGKEIIKFLDTMSIYRMSLAKVAKLIGMEKWDTPLELLEKEWNQLSKEEQLTIEKYCEQDCKITLASIEHIKEILKEKGISVQRLYTINQIAINYLVNILRKENAYHVLLNKKEGQVFPTYRNEEIKEAYRGGRNEAFKSGEHYGVNYIDINSLYPYCLSIMEFPDLRSERKVLDPLKYMDQEELFNEIGVSKCLIYNESDEIGLLAVRTKVGNYYPKEKTYIYGTWTHIELKEAMNRGYKIINIEWSVTYNKGENPFTKEMNKLYEYRKEGEFENYFYKMMMNAGIGKMAQSKTNMEMVVEDIERAEEYINKGFEIVNSNGMNYIMEKKPLNTPRKKYYMPIIPTLVNALARVIIYTNYKRIPSKNLIYSDTDSIMFQGDYLSEFKIGTKMGEFKLEVANGYHKNYGKKTYRINQQIHIGGVYSKNMLTEDFDNGIVLDTKMKTIATSQDLSEVGSFENKIEDLKEREKKFKEIERKFKEQKFFIDENTIVEPKSMEKLKKLAL